MVKTLSLISILSPKGRGSNLLTFSSKGERLWIYSFLSERKKHICIIRCIYIFYYNIFFLKV